MGEGKGISASIVSVILLISALLVFLMFFSHHVPDKKKYVFGVINPNPGLKHVTEGFISSMERFGYIEGKNTVYFHHSEMENASPFLQDMIKKKADLIFTVTTPAARKTKQALKGTDMPVVFGAIYDPVQSGVVTSLTNHKCNITGIKVGGGAQKALEWLIAADPRIKRIFVPVKFDTEAAGLSLDDLKKAALKLDIDVLISEVGSLDALQASMSSMPEDIDAVFIPQSIFIISNLDVILKTAVKRRLPLFSGAGQYKNGVTISYGQDHKRSGAQAARLAHRILEGTRASALPVETADFFLGINLQSARAVGLDISNDILQQADFIVR